jgi:hypothetical protein
VRVEAALRLARRDPGATIEPLLPLVRDRTPVAIEVGGSRPVGEFVVYHLAFGKADPRVRAALVRIVEDETLGTFRINALQHLPSLAAPRLLFVLEVALGEHGATHHEQRRARQLLARLLGDPGAFDRRSTSLHEVIARRTARGDAHAATARDGVLARGGYHAREMKVWIDIAPWLEPSTPETRRRALEQIGHANAVPDAKLPYPGHANVTFYIFQHAIVDAPDEEVVERLTDASPALRAFVADHVVDHRPHLVSSLAPLASDATPLIVQSGCRISTGETVGSYVGARLATRSGAR